MNREPIPSGSSSGCASIKQKQNRMLTTLKDVILNEINGFHYSDCKPHAGERTNYRLASYLANRVRIPRGSINAYLRRGLLLPERSSSPTSLDPTSRSASFR